MSTLAARQQRPHDASNELPINVASKRILRFGEYPQPIINGAHAARATTKARKRPLTSQFLG
jgi:hypothetical protein